MNPLKILQEEYYVFFKKEITGDEALKLFKTLPANFNEVIIGGDAEEFRSLVKSEIAYLGIDKPTIMNVQFRVLSKIIKQLMIDNRYTYKTLGRLVGLSERTMYDFIEYSHPINSKHLQTIFQEFGLALAPVTNAAFAEKYLQVVEDTEEPGDEDLNGPSIPMTPLEPSKPVEPDDGSIPWIPIDKPHTPIIPDKPDPPVEGEDIPLVPLVPSTPKEPDGEDKYIPLTPLVPSTPKEEHEGGDPDVEVDPKP